MASKQDETEDRVQKRCSDCGEKSPRVESEFTIISIQAGWRLTIGADAEGRRTMIWRCPPCFARFRERA